jgi:hypothetical protein
MKPVKSPAVMLKARPQNSRSVKIETVSAIDVAVGAGGFHQDRGERFRRSFRVH